ncbi:MAG: VRR-NUC domain-containing protein [Syntrophobacteraceae bacterium]
MRRKPEAVFQSRIIAHLRELYGARFWCANQVGGIGARAGIPDLLICIDGHFIALEIKNPETGGRMGPMQAIEIAAIRKAGGLAEVIRCLNDLKCITDRFKPTQMFIPR